MVVTIIPLVSMVQAGSPANTGLASKSRGSTAPVAKPQQEGAAAVSAPTPQNFNDDAQEEAKEEQRLMSAGDSLADLGGTRLSILQDPATERFVHRALNLITKEGGGGYPLEQELITSVPLGEVKGAHVDKKT